MAAIFSKCQAVELLGFGQNVGFSDNFIWPLRIVSMVSTPGSGAPGAPLIPRVNSTFRWWNGQLGLTAGAGRDFKWSECSFKGRYLGSCQ
jgi:hypothetical protein